MDLVRKYVVNRYKFSPYLNTSQNLLLDSEIRDWVFLPLLLMLIIAGLLRHYISTMLRQHNPKKIPYMQNRTKNTITRASRLRLTGSGFLSNEKWKARIAYWIDKEKGHLREEIEWVLLEEEVQEKEKKSRTIKDEELPDPMDMLSPMKGQFLVMLQNMVLMQGISYLFQGFILVKVPFVLSNGFKHMFQRGLDITNLDTSYVSSISWYFLVMFGLRGFFTLIIGENAERGQEIKESVMLQTDFGLSSNLVIPPGQKYDAVGALKIETENLEVACFGGSLVNSEKRLLGDRNSRKDTVSSDGNRICDEINRCESLHNEKSRDEKSYKID